MTLASASFGGYSYFSASFRRRSTATGASSLNFSFTRNPNFISFHFRGQHPYLRFEIQLKSGAAFVASILDIIFASDLLLDLVVLRSSRNLCYCKNILCSSKLKITSSSAKIRSGLRIKNCLKLHTTREVRSAGRQSSLR